VRTTRTLFCSAVAYMKRNTLRNIPSQTLRTPPHFSRRPTLVFIMDAITLRNREASNGTNGDTIQRPVMDEDKDINESVGSRSITPLPSVEDSEETFQIPTEKSNRQDPERRLKEFRARHIQMMALGTFPPF
jgi:hypothetical protein